MSYPKTNPSPYSMPNFGLDAKALSTQQLSPTPSAYGGMDFSFGGESIAAPAPTTFMPEQVGNYTNLFGNKTLAPTAQRGLLDMGTNVGAQVDQPDNGFDWMGNAGSIMKGIGSLGSMYYGMQGLDLAKDQFNWQKDFANRNFEASALNYNNQLDEQTRARLTADTSFRGTNAAQQDATLQSRNQNRYVPLPIQGKI